MTAVLCPPAWDEYAAMLVLLADEYVQAVHARDTERARHWRRQAVTAPAPPGVVGSEVFTAAVAAMVDPERPLDCRIDWLYGIPGVAEVGALGDAALLETVLVATRRVAS